MIKEKPLTSTKPYLIRAFYDWIIDNECTPHLMANSNYPGIEVPNQYVENGRIILNIDSQAVGYFRMTNDFIDFETRFSGVHREIHVPIGAVLAIYAQENGHGMIFTGEEFSDEFPETPAPISSTKPSVSSKPNLRIVK